MNKNFKSKSKFIEENKNSILNKFRTELHKTQSIIKKELLRSNELKLKFLYKRKEEKKLEEDEKKKILENLSFQFPNTNKENKDNKEHNNNIHFIKETFQKKNIEIIESNRLTLAFFF